MVHLKNQIPSSLSMLRTVLGFRDRWTARRHAFDKLLEVHACPLHAPTCKQHTHHRYHPGHKPQPAKPLKLRKTAFSLPTFPSSFSYYRIL
ncbi:hypothetical protein LY78DRAFT_135793 [Colletotrichum sublineola]|nr:hypothetical protein LY78DRAFT_135793 [Colletotrichum sublineola]